VYLFTHIFEKYSKNKYRIFGLVFLLLTVSVVALRHPDEPVLIPFVVWAFFVCGIRDVRWHYKFPIAYLYFLYLFHVDAHMY